MTTLVHALIGASIANKIPNPYLAGSTALLTHFFCDSIPHWDLGTNWKGRPKYITGAIAIFETIFSLMLIYLIFGKFIPLFLLFITVFLSLLPDFLAAPYFILYPYSPKIFYYIYKFQSIIHSRTQSYWGIVSQVVTMVIFLIVGFVL